MWRAFFLVMGQWSHDQLSLGFGFSGDFVTLLLILFVFLIWKFGGGGCLGAPLSIGWLCAYLIVCGIDFLAGLACLAGLVRRACFLIGGTPRC